MLFVSVWNKSGFIEKEKKVGKVLVMENAMT